MAQESAKAEEGLTREILIGIFGGLAMVVIVVTIGSVIGQFLSHAPPETEIQGVPVEQEALEAK